MSSPSPAGDVRADRLEQLSDWAAEQLGWSDVELSPASADASFRRYFRVRRGGESFILMDAPPPQEDCRPFVRVADLLRAPGLNVPEVFASDLARGFLLLSDLGARSYLEVLDADTADRLYGDAMAALLTIQGCVDPDCGLPDYDRALLLAEMELFREWLLRRHLGLSLSGTEQRMLDEQFAALAGAALSQPRVCVHRDYHSRNLMFSERHNPGILDFQDAVIGPVTYDLVSLLRDCYIAWPRERVEGWVLGYHELAVQCGILREDEADEALFLEWFDRMGVQRHLKASGIFARLCHRDGKDGYLGDIPRTLEYVRAACARHPDLEPLGELVQRVLAVL